MQSFRIFPFLGDTGVFFLVHIKRRLYYDIADEEDSQLKNLESRFLLLLGRVKGLKSASRSPFHFQEAQRKRFCKV